MSILASGYRLQAPGLVEKHRPLSRRWPRTVLACLVPARLAWFSPLPPNRSGIAAYSAEILGALSRRHRIHAYVETLADSAQPAQTAAAETRTPGLAVLDAHEFIWRHALEPYDLIVYQVGNDLSHDYLWPYMVRHPGLVVLHDGQLHQARAKALTWKRKRAEDYRAEFRYSHPDAPPGVADLVVAGLGGPILHQWPMLRVPIESARLVAVHNAWLAERLGNEFPDTPVRHIRMGVADPQPAARAEPSEVRERHGIPAGALVFAAFGRVTPEKRLSAFVEALSGLAGDHPEIRLMIVGESVGYYDLLAEARSLGVADAISVCGYVPDERLPEYLAAADIGVCLRWPTSRETSASWLRLVAAGKPTLVHDLAHMADVPWLDPRTMERLSVPGVTTTGVEPLGMAIDLRDEAGSIAAAIRSLAADSRLRRGLGEAARDYWLRHATLEHCEGDYEAAIEQAIATRFVPRPDWPGHLREDGSERASATARELGVTIDWR